MTRKISSKQLNQRCTGFTLIEMLVVFAVFAIMGVIASQIVSRVLTNQQLLGERGTRLAEVQRAMQVIQRDVLQINPRSVRDQLGDPGQPLLIGADGLMEFTRAGWRNPLAHHRSQLQRVAYIMRDGSLYRAYWPVLDRAPDSEPKLQALLSEVAEIEFFAVDVSGNEHSFWPLLGEFADDPDTQLGAIVMRIDIAPFGVVERLWAVASVP
ncbi:MAG: type II secretion system minor pseudopilin GspJ [Gammaproteobacteria bacterium]|nr:type II secretion system minor pseudopilin GspJ [Gammaproteobacteria bacterium]